MRLGGLGDVELAAGAVHVVAESCHGYYAGGVVAQVGVEFQVDAAFLAGGRVGVAAGAVAFGAAGLDYEARDYAVPGEVVVEAFVD